MKKTTPYLIKRYLKFTSLVCVFGMIPLIMYWAYNIGQARPSVVIKPLIETLICVWALFHLFLLILRSLPKATLLMLLSIFLFFTYGHIDQALPHGSFPSGFYLFVFYVLLSLVGSVLILRARHLPESCFSYLQFVAVILLTFNVVKIIRYDPHLFQRETSTTSPIVVKNEISTGKEPNVYYILLDEYARDDVLREVYSFDNSEFLQSLRDRGFYIPPCAMSNYEATHMTIPSVLNMDYLDQLGIATDTLDEITSKNVDLTLNDQVRKIFAGMGYKFVTARGWAPFADITNSDIYLNYYNSIGQPDLLAEKFFAYKFWNTTLVSAYSEIVPILQGTRTNSGTETISTAYTVDDTEEQDTTTINMNLEYEMSYFWYHQTPYVLDSLKEISGSSDGPYLVYAHIMCPHHPYVFNRDGSFRFVTDLTDEKTYYTDAVYYLNQQVLQTIDAILANSETPPIIILQADHGSRYFDGGINEHKILSAYYFPGDISLEPYDTITPVNDFRLILHDYFDPSIGLLPDQLFVKEDGTYHEEEASCSLK